MTSTSLDIILEGPQIDINELVLGIFLYIVDWLLGERIMFEPNLMDKSKNLRIFIVYLTNFTNVEDTIPVIPPIIKDLLIYFLRLELYSK